MTADEHRRTLLAEVLAERFPTATEVRAESRREVAAPPPRIRSREQDSADVLASRAADFAAFNHRKTTAAQRLIDERVARAQLIVAAARASTTRRGAA